MSYTTHTAEFPSDLDRMIQDHDPAHAAALAAWHDSKVTVGRFTWRELADRLAPRPEVIAAAVELADARHAALMEQTPYWQMPVGDSIEKEWTRMHEADASHIENRCRMLCNQAVREADTRETPGGLF